MPIIFEHNQNISGFLTDRGNLKIGNEMQLDNVRCHSHFIGLLKLLGIVEDVTTQAKEVVHINKSSLIKKFKEQYHPQGLSDKDIMHIIRSSCRQNSREALGASESQVESDLQTRASVLLTGEYRQSNIETFKRIQKGPLAGMGVRGGLLENTEGTYPRAIKIIDDLVSYLKTTVLSPDQLHAAIQEQLQIVKLMNQQGEWIDKELEKVGRSLLPAPEETAQKSMEFIDGMAKALKQNQYFLAAINNLDDLQLESIRKKMEGDKGIKMMQYMLPYAMALNGLTAAFAKDIHLFDKIDRMWTKAMKPYKTRKYLEFFGMVKYYTLGNLSRAKKPIKTKTIAKDANRHYLNINIMEAVIADMYLGNNNNAEAGSTLIRHPVGGKHNARTGAGPSTVEPLANLYDVIKLRPDLPKEWADLYTVWNFTFCSNTDNFPFLVLKLLIPSVNDYAAHPEAYIYHRSIALYLYFKMAILRGITEKAPKFLEGWHFPEITHAFGEANLQSARDYEERIRKAAA